MLFVFIGVASLRQATVDFKGVVKGVEDELLKIQAELLSTSGNRAMNKHLNLLAHDILLLQTEVEYF